MGAATVATDYDLKSLLDLALRNAMLGMNCHHVGLIQEFDPDDQTVKVQVAYKRTVSGVLVDFPILIDCPVVVLGNKTKRLEIPIETGDECLVLFNDRDIDNWFQSGQIGPLNTQRIHSLSDGFALVGVRSLLNSIEDWDNTRLSLRNGDTRVGVGASKVKIENSNRTANEVLNNIAGLTSDLQSALTTFATGLTVGSLIAKAAALVAQIAILDAAVTALKTTQIDDLLD